MRLRDLATPGEMVEIGSFHFTADKIIEFAKKFDPQPFHVDAEAARQSLFGGLCASGWHVCAAAMKVNIANIYARAHEIVRAGGTPPKLGPSPGFRNLKWLKPVFAEDNVIFFQRYNFDVPVPNRPGRHVCDISFEGRNDKGETVISFDCTVVEFE
jgi:acyl dehydratase